MNNPQDDNLSPDPPPTSRDVAARAMDGGPPCFADGPPLWPLPDPEIDQLVQQALRSGSWGRYEAEYGSRLVEQLRELHGVEHVMTCCSGTLAVELALRGLRVRPGDEVILAGYDFPGNFRAIEAVGAFPVLVDIEPRTWCLAAGQLQAAVNRQTRAVIVSHLHGGLADMRRITDMAHAMA